MLMNAFFELHSAVVHLCEYSRAFTNRRNRLHERCLRVISNEKQSNFQLLIDQARSFSIYHWNTQKFVIDMY